MAGWDIEAGMSNNAVAAYDDGYLPKSKWTKERIIECVCDHGAYTPELLQPFTKVVLFSYFMCYKSWHHTSRCFNETAFYGVDVKRCISVNIDALNKCAEEHKIESNKDHCKAETTVPIKGRITYEEWEGSRKRGSFKEKIELCLIVGNHAYTSSARKDLSGCHVKKVERFDRAPKGTANAYRNIQKSLPAKYRR